MLWRYKISGRIRVAETGEPLAGLVVRAWDKDLIFDDPLGDARTDAQGRFEIAFTDEQFRQVFDENPDEYLRVYDASGRHELHSTRGAVRRNAGEMEHFEIAIPAERLAAVGTEAR